ncbi:hypothetical protein Tco_0465508 [Tanacetum coccineum]
MVNREVQLQALVDGKKVIITESTIRRDLQLEDAEGVDCLPNATIFEQLTLIGVGKGFSGRETPLFPTMMVQAQEEMGEGSAMQTAPHHTYTITQPSTSQPQKKQKSRRPRRKDTEVPQPSSPTTNVVDEVVNKEMDNSLERAATTATSLDAKQDRGNINKTQSKATPTEPSSPGTSSGGGPRRQDTMGDTSARTRFERDDASKHGRIDDIDANEDIYLVNVHRDEDMFRGKCILKVTEEKGDVIEEPSVPVSIVSASTKVSTATTTTAATIRPRAKGLVIHEVEKTTIPIVASQQPLQVQDKGKGKMVKEEHVKKMSKKELLNLDEELAFKLQAEEDEEERLAKEKT